MDENKKRLLDIILSVIAPTITIVGILIGVWQFTYEQKNKVRLEYSLLARKKAVEFRRQLWLEQLKEYRQLSKLIGEIITYSGDEKKLNELFNKFLSIYWGMTIFVEDEIVEQAMVDFYLELNDYRNGWSNEKRIKIRAFNLVKTCHESSHTNWKQIEQIRGSN